ncbi:MAG: 2-oxoglutarate dehydrogenase E1 component, partial [Bacteroidales bacterium]
DSQLEACFNGVGPEDKIRIKPFLVEDWSGFIHSSPREVFEPVDTSVERSRLGRLLELITELPSDRIFFQKAHKIIEGRKKLVEADRLDWAIGELLAYASLLEEGTGIRLSGQDSERGTFAHRHAAWVQEDTGDKYYPLKQLGHGVNGFSIFNSPLSEYALLGFEYGYALAMPRTLTIWEAQFGDFANNAQVVIDQYIVSAEEKWGLQNGLVLFLPHGYEGQGPEHSSARIERFLTMAANYNITVANPTTPASLFHLLRRQMARRFRVPLVVFTPKSLLRHPDCTSSLDEFASGGFQEILDDPNTDPSLVKRVVFCWGKMYYELLKPKAEWNARDIALIRIEQMYPFPHERMKAVLARYPNAQLHIWVQEEPENMGAWRFLQNEVRYVDWIPVCRKASGSPATGLNRIHQITQLELVDKVFRRCTCELKNTYCGLQCVEGKSRIEILREFEYL